ncbi:cytochrome b, partial [Thalassobius vesicularis]
LALVALHVAGAFYHHFVLRDGTLARMRQAKG